MTEINDNAAYIVKRINELWDVKPCKKTLQKIVYLIEQKGIDLGYTYTLHFYGPYSSSLDAATVFLSADGIINFEFSQYSHLMSVDEDKFDIQPSKNDDLDLSKLDSVIEHLKGKTPSELELLSTAIYAYNRLQTKTQNNVISGVQKIKGSKYSQEDIRESLHEFSFFDKSF